MLRVMVSTVVTTLHVVDPKTPGAVDEILHLGDYWNEAAMRVHKAEIMALNREVGSWFQRAYRFLKAVRDVREDWKAANIEGLNAAEVNKRAAALIEEIFDGAPVADVTGSERHLFASAITPNGFVNYLPTVVGGCRKRHIVHGEPGTGKSTLAKAVADEAIKRGYSVELYHCALDPTRIEHILLPSLNIALVTSEAPHEYSAQPGDEFIDMNECVSPEIRERYRDVVAYDKQLCDELLDKAISFIARAKQAHDKMEEYYVSNMDFAAIVKMRDKTLKRILAYAEEFDPPEPATVS